MTVYKPPSLEGASLRAEAEAPFRSLRLFLFGAGAASATLATLFGLPPLIGALAGAPAAKPLVLALQDLAINVGAAGGLGFLVLRDLRARDKQLARLMREDVLGACQLELANGRVLRLAQLRGFVRVVVLAGSLQQVTEALTAAQPYREVLQERGVMVVPLPLGGGDLPTSADAVAAAGGADADLRWRATAIRQDDWVKWFEAQAGLAGKTLDGGLYVSLRLDGRVRGSGVGSPPWGALAAQLPPTEGFFGSFLDGMDGKVG